MVRQAVPISRAPFFEPSSFWGQHRLKSFQQLAFPGRKDQFAGELGNFSPEQGQQHHPPGDDGIDGNGPRQSFGAPVLVRFDLAPTFQNPMPLLNVANATCTKAGSAGPAYANEWAL